MGKKHKRREAAGNAGAMGYGAGYGAAPGYGAGYGGGAGYGAGPGYGAGMSGATAGAPWPGAADPMATAGGLAAGLGAGMGNLDAGLLQNLPEFLRSRHTEQFLLGALIGAAAAWVLSDEELRNKLLKKAMQMYAGVAGSMEEMKEQMADLRAEVEAEAQGDA